jgi:hypothetical protein
VSDPLDDMRQSAIYRELGRDLDPREVNAFFDTALEAGQQLFFAAYTLGRNNPALMAAILEAAWARLAAEAEDHATIGDLNGVLTSFETRLATFNDAVRRFYFPRWRQLLAEQRPNGAGQ